MITAKSTDGTGIAFEVAGEGEPLVLMHPSLSSSRIWWDLGYVDALSRDYRLILIDARGHGESDIPTCERDYALPRFVDDVITVLDTLEIESAHYMGYSLGGRVAFGCGAYAPERIRSLIIGAGEFNTKPGAFDRVTYPGALETIATDGVDRFLERWSARVGTALPEPVRAMFLRNSVQAMVPYLRQMELDPSLEDALPGIDHPALLFAGEHDDDRLPAMRIAAERMPNAELAVIPGANHMSALVDSRSVLDLVIAFLAKARTTAKRLSIA